MSSLHFGVLGTGFFGKNYIRLFDELDEINLKATAENQEEAEKIINDPNIDCLIVATPGKTHFDLVQKGIKSGKHILVEKPMVMNLTEAEDLSELVKNSSQIFMVSSQYLYNDYIQFLKKQIDQKMLGNIHYIHAEHFYLGALRSDMGVFRDAAPHVLSVIDYLFDSPQINGVQGSKIVFPGSKYDDFIAVNIKYDNNLLLSLTLSRFAPQNSRKYFIGGDKGLAVFDESEPANKLQFINHPYPGQSGFKGFASDFFKVAEDEIEIPSIEAGESLKNQLEHFIACVNGKKQPLSDIKHGLRVQNQLDFIEKNLV